MPGSGPARPRRAATRSWCEGRPRVRPRARTSRPRPTTFAEGPSDSLGQGWHRSLSLSLSCRAKSRCLCRTRAALGPVIHRAALISADRNPAIRATLMRSYRGDAGPALAVCILHFVFGILHFRRQGCYPGPSVLSARLAPSNLACLLILFFHFYYLIFIISELLQVLFFSRRIINLIVIYFRKGSGRTMFSSVALLQFSHCSKCENCLIFA